MSNPVIHPLLHVGNNETFIPVDEWLPLPQDMIFNHTKGAIILPVSRYYDVAPNINFDCFVLSTKRCYNSDEVRNHYCLYMNYFEKYYDQEHELLLIYYRLKYLIDYEPCYTREAFMADLDKYILGNSILEKAKRMNMDNYRQSLTYKNIRNPGLQYNDKHGSILMEISLRVNMVIPLLTHFIFIKKIQNVKEFLLSVFDRILDSYSDEVDIYNKIYETSISNVNKNVDRNPVLWQIQGIRSNNSTIHSLSTVENIILQIIPKYAYNKNMIHFNYESILRNLKYQVVDISYEYNFVSLSSSKREGEDSSSQFDKFESHLIRTDEGLYMQNKVNAESAMRNIEMKFGPFDQAEIDFYTKELTKDEKIIINGFQMNLVFNLFYSYFGDPVSIKAINSEQYVKLIISARRILEAQGMVILPYIISSKVVRLIERKNINKKEMTRLESSTYYQYIRDKYKNDKIEKQILYIISTILSSEFNIIDPYDPDLNGKKIESMPEFLIEEILLYIQLI